MAVEKHTLMGGELHVYKRPESPLWQCSTYLAGRNRRKSTGEQSLKLAKDVAEDWYLGLKGRQRDGEIKNEKNFREVAKVFEHEFELITEGDRSPQYIEKMQDRLRLHLLPFFGKMGISQITTSVVQEYRLHRQTSGKNGKPPSRSTMHQEIVALRQVLKTALRHGWIDHLPDLSQPYRSGTKVDHRAWFSHTEYKKLYEATRKRAREANGKRWEWATATLHDFVLFMANTGLRPDEVWRLEHRDVEIVDDEDTDETILLIEVRGKRGVGYCKSTANAVRPYERVVDRDDPDPTDLVFPSRHRELFNSVLKEEGLKTDRDGRNRTAYSLRHTYICFRLMEGADIYQVAKNCRTSVEMIEKFYAAHIRTNLDASAINVRRPRKRKQDKKAA